MIVDTQPPHVQEVFIRLVPPDPQGAMIDRLSEAQVLDILGADK